MVLCTYWRLRTDQVAETVSITTSEAVAQGGGTTRTITTTSAMTTARPVTQIVPGDV